jgi:hypothetical protein
MTSPFLLSIMTPDEVREPFFILTIKSKLFNSYLKFVIGAKNEKLVANC